MMERLNIERSIETFNEEANDEEDVDHDDGIVVWIECDLDGRKMWRNVSLLLVLNQIYLILLIIFFGKG